MSKLRAWVIIVRVESGAQPGMVSRVSRIFADRGISLSDVLATTREGNSMIVLCFSAAATTCDYLKRRLARFDEVRHIEVRPGDDRPPWTHLK